MDAILEQFIQEARDNLAYIDKHLGDLENADEETINALFRAAHTLKGGAGLVGFNAVKELTHAAEDLLDAIRNKKVEFNEDMLDALYDAFDEVVEMIDAGEEIGGVDIDVDEDRIEEIKKEVRKFLNQKSEKKELEIPFTLNNELKISECFNSLQVQRLRDIPIKPPQITEEFLSEKNYYLMDMDLDVDTIKLGNDPVYLFSLLEEDFLTAIQPNCEAIKEDPLNWASRICAVIKSDKNEIEDVFYNILDELQFRPLSIEALFDTNYSPSENEMLEDFKQEIKELISNGEFEKVDEKLSAITQVLNLKSREGFVLTRLQAILVNYDVGSEEYKEILKIALSKIGIDISEKPETKNEKSEVESKELEVDDKVKQNAINILKTQLRVLDVAKDSQVVERTKHLLKNVLEFLGLNEEIENISNGDELKSFIKRELQKLEESFGSEEPKVEEKPQPKEEQKSEPTPQQEKPQPVEKKPHHKQEAQKIDKVVKIKESQIDDLMDIVGELLVIKNALPYIADTLNPQNVDLIRRELLSKYEEISRMIEQLQDKVMQMRLLPLEFIFGRYPKMIRDISKKLHKKIKYIEEGADTKLDKMTIEKLADPLVHIIRNSLDHGIETPEERREKGKPEEGTLKISAKQHGDRVKIVISDDGRGIDVQKVINKALEKRLIEPEAIDKMSREEKLKLIFLPGLSTKDEITDLSGRGVGADAVKKVIEELGGKISIQSEIDKGTTITLDLPVSVALTNVFHIKMNGINYAIPMDFIVETVKLQKDDVHIANHKPFMKIRGELIPLLIEENLLNRSELKEENSIVIIKLNELKFGFVVDEFIGQLDVIQKPLNEIISNHPFVSGVSLLGNGEILFILEPNKILKEGNE